MNPRIAVSGRAEENPFFAETHAPRVVVGVAQELDLGTIRPKAVEPLPKRVPLAADLPLKSRIADHAVNPIVQSIAKVARSGVSIVSVPAGEQHAPFIRD